jgi:hypothetical protein
MLLMVLRKLARNRWLASCLLAGTVIAVALVASIPLYTAGPLLYSEPDFGKYSSLPGAALATRVFRTTETFGIPPVARP